MSKEKPVLEFTVTADKPVSLAVWMHIDDVINDLLRLAGIDGGVESTRIPSKDEPEDEKCDECGGEIPPLPASDMYQLSPILETYERLTWHGSECSLHPNNEDEDEDS